LCVNTHNAKLTANTTEGNSRKSRESGFVCSQTVHIRVHTHTGNVSQVLRDEHLADNAEKMGELLRKRLNEIDSPAIELVRGRGLLNAIVVKPDGSKVNILIQIYTYYIYICV